MANPNFSPTYSTWDIWRAGDTERCLDDDLNSIESNIGALETAVSTKANTNHIHSGYAATSHTHNYAPTSHSHDDKYYTEAEINTKLSSKANSNHNHDTAYDAKGSADIALDFAKDYTDSKIDDLVGTGASTTLDTIGEISTAIEDNQDAMDVLNAAIGTKAKASDLTAHTGNTTSHITSTERDNWNNKAEGMHTHNANDINTGTISIPHGGTGVDTAEKAAKAFGYNKVLWSGAWHMVDTHVAKLSEPVRSQPHGIVLVFSTYSGGIIRDYGFSTFFVPKEFVTLHGGGGIDFHMVSAIPDVICGKYLYIGGTSITGNANNNKVGTSAIGLKYENNYKVLRYVIGV